MPFRSERQRRFLFANHPKIAHAWAHGEHTSSRNHKMPSRSKRRGRKSSRSSGRR